MSMLLQIVAVADDALRPILADAARINAALEGEGDDAIAMVDLDKAWHGVHFLLTGTAWEGEGPIASLLLGGHASTEDVGYGPARGLTAAEARAFRDALAGLDEAELHRRFDPKRMTALEIYPDVWDRGAESEQLFEMLADGVTELRSILDVAVRESAGLIIAIT